MQATLHHLPLQSLLQKKKKNTQCGNCDYHKPFSQFIKVTSVTDGGEIFRADGKAFNTNSRYCVFFQWYQGLVILKQKQIIKTKNARVQIQFFYSLL